MTNPLNSLLEHIERAQERDVDVEALLDIYNHAQRRLDNGDYMPRVIEEAEIQMKEEVLVQKGFEK